MGSLEAGVPLAVEGCHGAEASGLGRLAVGPTAPPSAGRCGRRRHPRGPIGRQGYRSGSPPQGGPQGRAAVQGGRLRRRRRLRPLSRPCTWFAERVGLGGLHIYRYICNLRYKGMIRRIRIPLKTVYLRSRVAHERVKNRAMLTSTGFSKYY
jgi:hypothetical protein